MRLVEIKGDDFWDYQAEVIPEESIIAKIHRRVEIRSRPSPFDFDHISEEDNRLMDTYELINFFQIERHQVIPILLYPQPTKEAIGEVMREKVPQFEIFSQKIGQAQLWYSKTTKKCVLWECLIWSIHRSTLPTSRTLQTWKWLVGYIQDILGMKEIYTHDFDPAYQEDEYLELLRSLGFVQTEKPRIMVLKEVKAP